MVAFSAIGAYVATSLFGLAAGSIGAVLVSSVVAAGLATVASRVINGGSTSGAGGTTQDPGVRQQLPPATDNKVPVIYGVANTKGTVTDARITADNQTMTYVLMLSEKTQTGTFTIGDVYWNDELLTFGTGANTYKVVSSRDQNGLGSTGTQYANLIEVRAYAGSAQNSANQIFPTTNKVSAASYIGESTSTYQLNDLVYAVVKITYSAEHGVNSLAPMTFEVQNSLNNPGLVLYDYLTSPRYGAGFAAADIDTVSMTSNTPGVPSLRNVSNEIPANQFNSNGTTSTQARYVINGVLSTGDTVKNNFEKITLSSAAWLTYDFAQGKWKVLPNRALSAPELAAVAVYDDDSIMGEISVNATNLEDLYNSIEVEFASNEIRDQNDFYRASIAAVERNNFEPDNKLSLRFDLINNSIHAQRLGLIELNQSRVDKTIQFRTDYSGLRTQAGDIIKITNEVYGFVDKLFRVTRVREMEDETGALMAEISGLEYNATVYGDSTITAYQPNTASGIPSFGGPTALPAPGTVAIVSQSPSANQPTFRISTTLPATSGPVDRVLWYYTTTPNSTSAIYITDEVGPFTGGQTVSDDIFSLSSGTYYLFARSQRAGNISEYSDNGRSPPPGPFTYSTRIDWNPTPAGASNGIINTSTFSSQLNILTTSTGAAFVPLVSATAGFQPVYADADLTFSAAPNTLNISGVGASMNLVSTGTRFTAVMTGNAIDRFAFQTNTVNGQTNLNVLPNGSGTVSSLNLFATSNPVNSSRLTLQSVSGSSMGIDSGITGTGTQLPLVLLTAGVARVTIAGNTGVVTVTTGTNSGSTSTGALVVSGGVGIANNLYVGGQINSRPQTQATSTATGAIVVNIGGIGVGGNIHVGQTLVANTVTIAAVANLAAQTAVPASFTTGTLAFASGSTWNPTQEPTGGPGYMAYYNGAEWRAIGQPTIYGQFFSTGTSSISTVTQAQVMIMGNTAVSYGVFNTTATAITLAGPGVYKVLYSVQFTNSSRDAEYAYVWYRQNGANIADSNSIFSVPGKHGARDGALIGTVELFITTASAGEYVELYWGAESTTISVVTTPAGVSPTRPRTPGVIVTVTKVK